MGALAVEPKTVSALFVGFRGGAVGTMAPLLSGPHAESGGSRRRSTPMPGVDSSELPPPSLLLYPVHALWGAPVDR